MQASDTACGICFIQILYLNSSASSQITWQRDSACLCRVKFMTLSCVGRPSINFDHMYFETPKPINEKCLQIVYIGKISYSLAEIISTELSRLQTRVKYNVGMAFYSFLVPEGLRSVWTANGKIMHDGPNDAISQLSLKKFPFPQPCCSEPFTGHLGSVEWIFRPYA